MQYHQSESHHKEIAACTDEQLCAMAAAGDREAADLLVTRYYGMVRACARPLFLAGGDGEDLIQEGMFGLIQAIREYDADKAASFHTYAEICIRNRLFSALRAASRGKHYPLNESISLDTPSFDSSSYTAGTLDPSHTDPELLIAERDHVESLLESTRKHLSEDRGQDQRGEKGSADRNTDYQGYTIGGWKGEGEDRRYYGCNCLCRLV